MHITLWHGTNQAFDRFDTRFLSLANPNSASDAAFFFAGRRDTAEDYARKAERTLIPDQVEHEARIALLIARSETARRRGQHDLCESLILQAEELETQAMQAPPSGAAVLMCDVIFSNPFEIDGSDRRVVTNLAKVLEEARAAGHDCVILRDICDTPSGTTAPDDHVAVFDVEQIEILERIELDAAEAELEPEMDFGF